MCIRDSYWCALGTEIASQNVKGYAAYNPLGRILPLLYRYGSEPAKLLKVLSYPANEASIAVSYTHLDVYKRQFLRPYPSS